MIIPLVGKKPRKLKGTFIGSVHSDCILYKSKENMLSLFGLLKIICNCVTHFTAGGAQSPILLIPSGTNRILCHVDGLRGRGLITGAIQ